MRVASDDDVYRVNAVWLGPRGLTFPWTARYLAYATWLVTFLVVLLIKSVTMGVGVPPVWEICITTLFTYAVMSFVDHERPVRAVWSTFVADLSAPRAPKKPRAVRVMPKVRVRSRPQHDRRLTRATFGPRSHAERTIPATPVAVTDGPPSGQPADGPGRPARPHRPGRLRPGKQSRDVGRPRVGRSGPDVRRVSR